MTDLEQLLDVQAHDTRIDQLRHRRATLAEIAEIADAEKRVEAEERRRAEADQRRATLAAEQRRLEHEAGSARERISSAEAALYGGAISNPRELQALQDEIASLNRRVGLLEDDEIAVMEQLEPVEAAIAEHDARIVEERATIDRLRDRLSVAEAEIDVELDAEQAARAVAVAAVPDALLGEYEAIRARAGGIGVARLSAGVCGGCHLRLPAVEVDRIKKLPPDALAHCEECGRLLVR
jgi:predicted  nucleic acid-binding Zn-ribbon protein